MRKLYAQLLLIFSILCFSCSSVCFAQAMQSEKAASINIQDALSNKSETVLRKDYVRFLTTLDTNKITQIEAGKYDEAFMLSERELTVSN